MSTTTTTTTTFQNLNWAQRLQIAAKANVSSQQASNVFGCSEQEYLQASTDFDADITFNVDSYLIHFSKPVQSQPATVTVADPAKKRGRKSSKIADAFSKITFEKQSLVAFCLENNVSAHCIRQRKRFAPDRLDVRVGKDKETGLEMVWKINESPSIDNTSK